MRFAYADPPYLGCAKRHYKDHPNHAIYDTIEGHRKLIATLVTDYPEGWALSCTSGNLHDILPLVPRDCRIAAWVKPFAVFKPNVNPGYCWEPVIWYGGRRGDRTRATVRDFLSANITLKKGLVGAKPEAFCRWILDLLGWRPGDEMVDLFPGTSVMDQVVADLTARPALACVVPL